ncbi:MAG: hypothetical protein H0T47_09610 [Planctomycetaceae bacterium]|nr:hypothetical protein [Planctomycetaceae bacterium]
MAERRARIRARTQRALIDSAHSLAKFRSHAAIDSRPDPRPWGTIREPWQAADLRPVIPAIEAAAGWRPPLPEDAPRFFWRTRPRGHFKTGEIALLMCGLLAFSPRRVRCVSAATDRDQAREVGTSMEAMRVLNPWFSSRVEVNKYDAYGPGGTLEILSSDVGGSSGKTPDISVFDELTYWKDKSLADMLLAAAVKRPGAVVLIITNAGILGTWQHELKRKCQADPMWDVRETPPGVRPATWMDERTVASLRAKMTTGHARRVFDNVWTDAADDPLFPADLIAACSRPRSQLLWPDATKPPIGPRNLLLGYDVGKVDRAALWVIERTGPRQYAARVQEAYSGVTLANQESRVRSIIKACRHRLVAGHIDKGSIGFQLAETLQREFHGIIQGVACGSTWQGRTALAVHLAAREGRLLLPGLETGEPDPMLVADFGQVEQVGDRKDGTPEVSTLRTDAGHADRLWGLALAIDADSTPSRPQAGGASVGPYIPSAGVTSPRTRLRRF